MTEAIETAKAVGLTLEELQEMVKLLYEGWSAVEPILEVKNLCKNYGNFSLKNVNIRLDRGYIMGFIGPNGAGKSTTIKLIMNLIKKDSGTIKIFQLDHQKNELAIKDRIGFVYDENYYYEELTVEEMKTLSNLFIADGMKQPSKLCRPIELPLKTD